MKVLQVRNRQRKRIIDARWLRSLAGFLVEDLCAISSYQLVFHLVSARRMAELNERFLGHSGSTDVITFDLREGYDATQDPGEIAGEVFICVEVAERQAVEFETSWEAEVIRYIVHGVLHLKGYDDLSSQKRKIMKREENRLVRALERKFRFIELGR